MSSGVRIALLADHPELFDTVIGWHWREWSNDHADAVLDEWRATLVARSGRDGVPFTLVALIDEVPVGCLSVCDDDKDDRYADRTPWLSGMLVIGPARNQGVGRDLLRAAEAQARGFGARQMWLRTDTADAFYRRCGWDVVVAKERVGDHAVMRRDL